MFSCFVLLERLAQNVSIKCFTNVNKMLKSLAKTVYVFHLFKEYLIKWNNSNLWLEFNNVI